MRALALALVFFASCFAGCGHSYASPFAVAVQTGPGQQTDVAWFIEDGGRIIRCVNGPDRPICRRANVD